MSNALFSRKNGTMVTTRVLFTKIADATPAGPADPGVVTLVVERPDETTVTETYNPGDIVRDSLGVYHFDIATDNTKPEWVGTWTVQWQGAGDGPNVLVNGNFYLDAPAVD